jgi:hypothetical protein
MPLWTWFDKSFPEYYARLDKVHRKTCSKKFSCVDFYMTSGTGKFVWHKKNPKNHAPLDMVWQNVFQKTMPL